MLKSYLLLLGGAFLIFGCVPGSSNSTEKVENLVSSVFVNTPSIKINHHKKVLLGASCESGPIGEIPGNRRIRVGQIISFDNRTIKIGVITLDTLKNDLDVPGIGLLKKGTGFCAMAESENMLPHENDCNALWLSSFDCKK
ncbi:MAG: hypothetical protein OEW39_00515 [Deltaproteobacteria bacterium]|nr:hypothetical protein [Deltaproteobacteria bacterium]